MKLCALMILGVGLLCTEPRDDRKVVDTACRAFEPLTWSRRDTAETIRRAKEHNAVWTRLCGAG